MHFATLNDEGLKPSEVLSSMKFGRRAIEISCITSLESATVGPSERTKARGAGSDDSKSRRNAC